MTPRRQLTSVRRRGFWWKLGLPTIGRSQVRPLSWLLAFLFAIVLSTQMGVGQAAEPVETLLQQSRQRYEAGQLDQAKTLLQQVQQQSQQNGDALTTAVALSNLALIEGDQGNWAAANQAIADSLKTLESIPPAPLKTSVLAQALNVQGRLQLAQGNPQAALQSWQQTAGLHRQLGNPTGEIQSQLRQVQALQALGLYSRAYQKILLPLQDRLTQEPDSPIKTWGLRSLGETVGLFGSFKTARETLEESLNIADRLQNPQELAASRLSLANLLYARVRETRSRKKLKSWEKTLLQQDTEEALALYQQVTEIPSPNQLRAQLSQFALLVDSDRSTEAEQLAAVLEPIILQQAADRTGIEARLNFANSWLRFKQASFSQPKRLDDGWGNVEAILTVAVTHARALNDPRLLANALGNLGRVQEQSKEFASALNTTGKAVLVARSANASEQYYRWSVQLGRLQERQGDRTGAIESYTQAVNTLRSLRSDLLGVNSEALLVDQESLEPVHRQLVSLLLPADGSQPDGKTLRRTREVIESLQLEEINNYLRAACLQSQVEIDKVPVPQKTAIVYPIILPDRIATIVSATDQEPKLYTQTVDQTTVETTVEVLQEALRNRISLEYQQPAKQLYQWVIAPIAEELQSQQVETLVFVLDGAFRSIPMAALWDGDQFLIEQYSIATTPGLKLASPQPLQAQDLSGVAFGLSEAKSITLEGGSTQNFSELPSVEPELQELEDQIQPVIVKLNETFTVQSFQKILGQSQAPIVHLATHGQFSSNREQTFLLTFDGVLDIDELSIALGGESRKTPIELLVLSACETAIGDDRAPLGLAGIALRSGARSTIASLWKVSDNATSLLMQRLYQEIATRKVTKAVALQRAQQAILDNPDFRRHPYFWAPFILVGNWL